MANQTNNDSRELDLGHFSRKLRGYASRVNDSLFDAILFAKKYWIVLILLIVAGVFLGLRSDRGALYEHKILVRPNFGSTEFLYEEAEMVSNKLRQRDTAFLNMTGINRTEKLAKIEVEPVVDIYNFIDDPSKEHEDNDRMFQTFRIIAEGGDIQKTVENDMTSRNYTMHLITIYTREPGSKQEIAEPLLNYLNANPYYKKMQEEYINNLNLKIAANDTVIKQIDAILNDFSKTSGKGTNLMYYNDNTELNEVIKMKDYLTREQGRNRIDKVDFSKIITDRSMAMNMKVYKITTGMMKYVYPILLVLLFVAIVRFINFYKKQVAKRKIITTNE